MRAGVIGVGRDERKLERLREEEGGGRGEIARTKGDVEGDRDEI